MTPRAYEAIQAAQQSADLTLSALRQAYSAACDPDVSRMYGEALIDLIGVAADLRRKLSRMEESAGVDATAQQAAP